jgi:hypothetical protein
MRKKLLVVFVCFFVFIIASLGYFFTRPTVNLSVFGFQTKAVLPQKRFQTDRGVEYPLGISDQFGGFTEFSGTVVAVTNQSNDKSIIMNVTNESQPLNVKLFFENKYKDTLAYETKTGIFDAVQTWKVVPVVSILKELKVGNQAIIYIKGQKAQVISNINSSGVFVSSVGPIDKIAVYAN